MVEKNRMRVAGIRSPEEDDIGVFDFVIGTGAAARSEDRRQTDDAGSVSSAVTTVDVVAADHRANEFLRNVIQLVGGLGATEHSERARVMFRNGGAEALSHSVERLVPRSRAMPAIFADERLGEPAISRNCHKR